MDNGRCTMEYPVVQTLWVGGDLSRMERLCLSSFVDTGHEVRLYVYDAVDNVPQGVKVMDASEILPRDKLWRYGPAAREGAGSWAGAANLFRYALLFQQGGYWVDTDVVALRRLQDDCEYFFAREDSTRINNAVLKLPPGCELAKLLLDTSMLVGGDCVWGETGPRLLTEYVSLLGLTWRAAAPGTVYPVPHTAALDLVRSDPLGAGWRRLRTSNAVHLWNEIWRRAGIDKEARQARSSVFERLCRMHSVG
jgi:hypothetical protein